LQRAPSSDPLLISRADPSCGAVCPSPASICACEWTWGSNSTAPAGQLQRHQYTHM
jgi:hypothetical protein